MQLPGSQATIPSLRNTAPWLPSHNKGTTGWYTIPASNLSATTGPSNTAQATMKAIWWYAIPASNLLATTGYTQDLPVPRTNTHNPTEL